MIGLLQGLGVWIGAIVVVVGGFSASKNRDKRLYGRALMARHGLTDYRMTDGRWRSELYCDEVEHADQARDRWR